MATFSLTSFESDKSINFVGKEYELPQYKGRGIGIQFNNKGKNVSFVADGDPADRSSGIALRVSDDRGLALEVNHRKFQSGTDLSLWCSIGHPEWCCRFVLNSNRTFSPVNNRDLVVGSVKSKLKLVHKNSRDAIMFDLPPRLTRIAEEAVERERAEEERKSYFPTLAESFINAPGFLKSFQEEGFAKLSNAVDRNLIDDALLEINKELGESSSGTDKFKAKTFAGHKSITNLFNESVVPFVMTALLGGDRTYSQGAGQLALRFPGDACIGKTSQTNTAHSAAVAEGWHIDGCPNNFIPGVTDHYGKIMNFDCLVGVCLSKTEKENSGELCVWPGSHDALAKYFQVGDNLERVQKKGTLPLKDTKDLFKTPPIHCLAEPGDVFLANYMTAHYIAPNTSPHIRYAVYFRVHGPKFDGKIGNCPESMLSPWCHWPPMNQSSSSEAIEDRWRNQDNAFIESKQETAFAVIDAYQSLDNFHLTSTPSEGKGWSCKFCTYSHEKQAEAIMLTCAMCGGERESG